MVFTFGRPRVGGGLSRQIFFPEENVVPGAFQAFETRPSHASKNTRCRTWLDQLNDLQQLQHEKGSLVCVHAQSASGMALIPCALSAVGLSGRLRC